MTGEVEEFIARWAQSGGGERANFQPFIGEVCQLVSSAASTIGLSRRTQTSVEING